jgi:hypothetical protein
VLRTLYTWPKNEYSTLAAVLYGEPDDSNWYRSRGITTDGIRCHQIYAAQ